MWLGWWLKFFLFFGYFLIFYFKACQLLLALLCLSKALENFNFIPYIKTPSLIYREVIEVIYLWPPFWWIIILTTSWNTWLIQTEIQMFVTYQFDVSKRTDIADNNIGYNWKLHILIAQMSAASNSITTLPYLGVL